MRPAKGDDIPREKQMISVAGPASVDAPDSWIRRFHARFGQFFFASIIAKCLGRPEENRTWRTAVSEKSIPMSPSDAGGVSL